ncbi:exported hypothetical protein [Verrucomicrobia bacterium]|nr:exported hypothetical protein [Verrucomicrobiota bacterium]
MNFRFPVVETNLNRAEFRWKWLRFLERSLLLGSLLCWLALVFGAAMLLGWVKDRELAVTFFSLLVIGGLIAWTIILVAAAAGGPGRASLAAALERADHRLLDRLHTILFLERQRPDTRGQALAGRIAGQVQGLVDQKAFPRPFTAQHSWVRALAFAVLLATAILFYQRYSPWQQVLVAEKAKAIQPIAPERPLELALPTNNVEQDSAWGEVRITDPGTDLKVTKVDVVPLQIEAAANQALKKVDWSSTINGGAEAEHPLPAPAEPRYAVYQPAIYLDELHLSDWDVMTYYAKAKTEKENSYASEVYFLEVRPFREDILKLPGGEGGQAYESLNEMSALIERQQHIIRQTHQHVQKPWEQETLQSQDRKKLADAEGDLSESTRHLYAKMASDENKPIGDALDNLAKAEESLGGAAKLLRDNAMNEAPNRERRALAELVAARKTFQKAVTDNPKAFEPEENEQEPAPTAEASKKLNEIAEFRNESEAARGFVQKTLDEQKKLEQQARTSPRDAMPQLADKEQQLQKSLQDFQDQHPQVFKGSEPESQQAQQAMESAANALQQKSREAARTTRQATQQLEKFNSALNNQAAGQQLAHAYRLKKMLDNQIQTLDQRAKGDPKISDDQLNQTAGDARTTIDQLKKTAEQEPTRDAFGRPLREALSGQKKVDLDAKLTQLQQAQDGQARQQRAAEARDALGQVSQAFAASEPAGLQQAQKGDRLKPPETETWSQGMSELDSLIKQLENNRPVPPEDQAKQRQQALANLQNGVRNQFADSDRADQLLLQLQEALKTQQPDIGDLKKLMDQLRHFSVETSEHRSGKEDQPELTNIDPARLAPAYRGRIQKYFQKLSEK